MKCALEHFNKMFKNATIIQIFYNFATVIFSLIRRWMGGNKYWLNGGLLYSIIVSFTMIAMMPTNNAIFAAYAKKEYVDEANNCLNLMKK